MPDLLRMIDANLNRAREGLRVMEDVARFVLDDAALTTALKGARHDLRGLADRLGLDAALLAAERDTPADVGTGLSTQGERSRSNAMEIAIAAGKRTGEALRSIEEATKAMAGGDGASEGFKSLRYRVYECEKRLTLALGSGRARQWRLCVLVSESLCKEHAWDQVAEMALAGGADCLQLREKGLHDPDLLGRARRIVAIARAFPGAAVIVNDRPDIALLAGADGVHVGQRDLPIAEVRRIAGLRLLVGVSTSNLDEAISAARDGADYCGVGPMFASSTKFKPVIAGPEFLQAYIGDSRTGRVPHLAIGGVDAARAADLAKLGCRGVAVSSAACAASDPRRACEEIVAAFG